ncbi:MULTISPECIES: hypothetical protein [unclassified Nonomuraea]|uniref:hypothetical protein n=1 Tax=unclassified Nonomuraea TaxID=2593643 RepID=UPI0033DECFF3
MTAPAEPTVTYQGKRRRLWQGRLLLDWTGRGHWRGGRPSPCRLCHRPCLLVDDDGRPVHKVCLEQAITADLLTRSERDAA